jgi:hypothetical protein
VRYFMLASVALIHLSFSFFLSPHRTPLLAAVQRGHQDVSVFLVDTHRRTHCLKEHKEYLKRRTVKGHDAFKVEGSVRIYV